MKYRLMTAVAALAAVSFAAPASADAVWRAPTTDLVCSSLTISAPISGDPNLLPAGSSTFSVTVINKNGLAEKFNTKFGDFCYAVFTELQEACEHADTNYSYAKVDKKYTLTIAANGPAVPNQCPVTLGGIAGNSFSPSQGANITAIQVDAHQ